MTNSRTTGEFSEPITDKYGKKLTVLYRTDLRTDGQASYRSASHLKIRTSFVHKCEAEDEYGRGQSTIHKIMWMHIAWKVPNVLEWINMKFHKNRWINDRKTEKKANRLISDGPTDLRTDKASHRSASHLKSTIFNISVIYKRIFQQNILWRDCFIFKNELGHRLEIQRES